MAARYWVSTGGDWSSTTSWSTTQGGSSGAAVPVTGDDVYLLDGSVSVTAGLAQSGVDLESLTVGPGYQGSIGAPGSALAIAVSNNVGGSTFKLAGAGAQYNITAGTNGIDVLAMNLPNTGTTVNLVSGTTVAITGGSKGRLAVLAAAVVSGSCKLAGMSSTWEDNATDLPTFHADGGSHITKRDFDAIIIGPNTSYTTLENVTVDTSITLWGTWNCQSTGTCASLILRATGTATAVGGPGCTVTAAEIWEGGSYFVKDTNMTLPSSPTRVGAIR